MNNANKSIVDFGVSGYINTDVELKTSERGVKYVSVLLGRGQDARGNNLPSDAIVLYSKDAELFALKASKGDLVRFTKVALQRVVEDNKTYASSVKLVGKDFVKISAENTKDEKISFVDFGVSGYVNTEVELKTAENGTKYVSLLLGRGKDSRGNNLPSDSVVLYNKDAELFAEQIQKGDLIRFTKVALQRVLADGKTYAGTVKLVGKDWEKINGERNTQQNPQRQEQQKQEPVAQQAKPQPAQDYDSFDDDIPF